MNGYDWTVTVTCSTDGTSSTFTGPWALVAGERTRWLEDHGRHEFTLETHVERPQAEVDRRVVNVTTRAT